MTITTFNKITYYIFPCYSNENECCCGTDHVTVVCYLHYGNEICHEINENNGPKIKQIYTFHLFRIYLF